MRQLLAGLAITLDGVVESPTWMNLNDEANEVIAAGTARADTVLLGRRTYLEFATMWPDIDDDVPMAKFLNNTPKYVVSRTLAEPLDWAHSTLLSGDLAAEVARLRAMPGRDIIVPGSPRLVRSLLGAGLLDELALMVHPLAVGTGERLLDGLSDLRLELVDSRAFRTGVVSVTYRPIKE